MDGPIPPLQGGNVKPTPTLNVAEINAVNLRFSGTKGRWKSEKKAANLQRAENATLS